MSKKNTNKDVIDLLALVKILLSKKKVFFIVWPVVFGLSCLWIFPQPRYYECEVSLAPEAVSENAAGGLASLASNFGFDLGGGGVDAIYPMLYPDLMESNQFIVDILGIQVTTEDKSLSTDYYTYQIKHQKKNWLTQPFKDARRSIEKLFETKKSPDIKSGKELDPFILSDRDFKLVEKIREKITCDVDKKTEVITIKVQDQDRMICATLADSVSQHLQNFIINYRTNKARVDERHYKELTDSAQVEYDAAVKKYSAFCDANQDVLLQSAISQRDKMENDMQMKYNTYQAMKTQYEAMKAKVQEKTPAFTILKCATVPIKPAGPKRVLFVLGMLILSTLVTSLWLVRHEIAK